jgi:restriction system protein
MADLPKSADLLQPLLRALKNGVVLTNDQIRNEVARELSLTPEQLNQIHSGSRTELEYRLAWARTNAKGRKLIESPKRECWQITELGKTRLK